MGLLHAEAESALEFIVKKTLDNSVQVTSSHQTHKVLANALMYYKRHLGTLVPELKLIPKRKDLEKNPQIAVALWNAHVRDHYDGVLEANHGAGAKYVERLLHPLGIVVDRDRFKKLEEGAGLKEIADVADIGSTDLRELVSLRGVAMHANQSMVATRLSVTNPREIGRRGEAAANFTMNLAKKISRSAW
ncbi:hypothetical protein ACFV1C_02115 [Streptomyces sp. NPDC059605]|uniref:hypothetical protein n=1 Tax=unclassified Streptomyces TaxID=2593676 RepID=UPI00368EA4C4